MRVEFDRDTCVGMFNCVAEWEKFTENYDEGKATLVGGKKVGSDRYIRKVPVDEQFKAKMAARVCPVDAITVYEDDDQSIP